MQQPYHALTDDGGVVTEGEIETIPRPFVDVTTRQSSASKPGSALRGKNRRFKKSHRLRRRRPSHQDANAWRPLRAPSRLAPGRPGLPFVVSLVSLWGCFGPPCGYIGLPLASLGLPLASPWPPLASLHLT